MSSPSFMNVNAWLIVSNPNFTVLTVLFSLRFPVLGPLEIKLESHEKLAGFSEKPL